MSNLRGTVVLKFRMLHFFWRIFLRRCGLCVRGKLHSTLFKNSSQKVSDVAQLKVIQEQQAASLLLDLDFGNETCYRQWLHCNNCDGRPIKNLTLHDPTERMRSLDCLKLDDGWPRAKRSIARYVMEREIYEHI